MCSMEGESEAPGLGSSMALQQDGLCLPDPLRSQVFGTRAAVLGPAQRSAGRRARHPPAETRPVELNLIPRCVINKILIITAEDAKDSFNQRSPLCLFLAVFQPNAVT